MERDRLSIHIWSDAEITVEERKNCIKTVKRITMNDFIHCIQDSTKDLFQSGISSCLKMRCFTVFPMKAINFPRRLNTRMTEQILHI